MKATISLPKHTHLSQVERHASRLYGGMWQVETDASGVWCDPDNPKNFIWLVRRRIFFSP